ncbi:hypothetical protein J4438_02305 [Candidatus Woesearchaeota archaeon]|nr:hypothetical protein [Candidatus Woesearchaeota archaeon]
MSEIVPVVSTKIKDKGVFSMDNLYKGLKDWLVQEGYGDEATNFKEDFYVERIKGDFKQLEIGWKGEKVVTSYFANQIKISIRVTSLKDVEIEKDGKKFETNKVDIDIKIESNFIKDRENRWTSDFFRNLYEKYIIKERAEDYMEDLYNKTYSLANEVKKFLELSRA